VCDGNILDALHLLAFCYFGDKKLPFYDIDKLPLEDYTEAPSYEIAGISDTKPGEKIVWYEWHWNRKITTAVAGAFLFSLVG